ncbi:MAG TPA: hypothetical protein VFH70_04575 [Acidimicrobiales bacterium]|nr:hypothetical protein [Acidimicrobiales bacterium]
MAGVDIVVVIAVITAVGFSLLVDPASSSRRRRAGWQQAAQAGRLAHAGRRAARIITGAPAVPRGVLPRHVLRGSLLFTERIGPRTLGLDCMLAPATSEGRVAVPVQVTARCSVTWWAAERFMELVQQWSAGDEPVTVQLVPYRGHLRAQVARAGSWLILDVINATELTATVARSSATPVG